MRSISMRLAEMEKVKINIGYVGENEHTTVLIDCKKAFDEYPEAVASLTVRPPRGGEYPAVVVRNGNVVEWTVTDSDLIYAGNGEIQLTFTVGEVIVKTAIGTTVINRSLMRPGDIPTPIQNWIEQANQKIAAAEEATREAKAAAEHQPIIDDNGNWNTWDDDEGAYVDTGIKAQGEDGAPGRDGQDGQDGKDGKDGQDGAPGQDGTDATPDLITVPYEDLTFPVAAGTQCYHGGKLYEANQAIQTSEQWTAAHWTETTVEAQLNTVKSDLQAQKEDTDDSFANLISVVEGYDVFKATLTEGYFASYNTKTIAALSECNVATLDVTRVVKFKYNYTINIPDARGLFFEDKNGNKLESYQTLTTEQDITVPEGAVKCYATVLNTEDVVAYEIVGDKPVEILKDQATYTDKDDSGGIKYKWSDDHKTITISGTRTGNSFDGMAGTTSSIPTGMIPGKKYQLVFNPVSDKILFGVLVYKNGSQISQKLVNKPTIYKIPEDATGVMVRIIVNGANAVVNETVNCPEIYTVPETKSIAEQINDLNDAAYGSDTDPLAYIRRDAGLLSVFHKVGCIGDSLASGASAYKSGGVTQYTDNYDFSWGQCLARLTGNTYYNFSAGGLSTRTWLASQKATDCFDGNHTCDAYFIGLGQNDKNNSIPVGTTADINLSDYTQNADTYCGNMGKIIQKVQELQPKAPIFVFIDPLPPSGDQAYNNVIDDIVELFDNVWIIDLLSYSKGMFSNSFDVIGSQYRSGHYSAVGYQEIAHVIATYTDWIIRHNLSDFSQVEFIGTNYEWTT